MNNTCEEGQPFGANYNGSYAAAHLAGHTGQDWTCGFGTPIRSPYEGTIYKVLTKERPAADGSGFTGVFMIVDNGIELFEWLEGHCDPSVAPSQRVLKGDVIGTEANHGEVFVGNKQITLAMQAAGDKRGSHRHYQKRPVYRSRTLTRPCLSSNTDENGSYLDPQGFYYPIFDYFNGYNGCVDPALPTFRRDLTLGASGYDVFVLQRFLASQGLFHVEPTAFFGPVTQQGLSAWQKAHGIEPTLGYFGPKSRAAIAGYMLPAPDLGHA